MSTILTTLTMSKQLLRWTVVKLQANELWIIISYHKLLRVLGLGGSQIRNIIGVMALYAFVQSQAKNR